MNTFFARLVRALRRNCMSTREIDRLLILQASSIAKSQRNLMSIAHIGEVEFSAFSQWGEDGILDWLVERLSGIPRTFVEFGVEDYRESNTRLLLHLRNWSGLIMDASAQNIDSIRSQEVSWRFDLTSVCAFINRENINSLIGRAGFDGDIGLLSIDVDGNDYWIWERVEVVRPVIVVCEYNAVLGDVHSISVPYDPAFERGKAHHSNLYFGASLRALKELGARKGYAFVGTNTHGCNAFFVREDYAALIESCISEARASPSHFRQSRDSSGALDFVKPGDQSRLIVHLPIYDFESSSIRPLGTLGTLCSAEWQELQR